MSDGSESLENHHESLNKELLPTSDIWRLMIVMLLARPAALNYSMVLAKH